MAIIKSAQTLGAELRATRKRIGLTQAEVALTAGVGLRFVVELERGKPTVRLEQVLRVIDVLGGTLTLIAFDAKEKPTLGRPYGA
jgi:HTH-type transcriptional regulator/antitoxin HipB